MSRWIKNSWLKDEVGPGARTERVASENLGAYVFVADAGGAEVSVATQDHTDVLGVAMAEETELGDSVVVAHDGPVTLVADCLINAGEFVKVGNDGKAMAAISDGLEGQTIDAQVGLAFTNQPANDGLEIGSDNAADTMQVTVYGTTNGGVVVVKETVTLTGTTFVSTTKTDWGVILGFEIPVGQPTAQGTITVREASGNLTVSTLAAGSRYKGVAVVPEAEGRAFNRIITAVAEGATTKVVGVVGADAAGDEQLKAVTLAGTAVVPFTAAFKAVTKVLTGDLESSRTATFKTTSVQDPDTIVWAQALEDADEGDQFSAKLGHAPTADLAKGLAIWSTQTIDMADAQVALVHTVAGAGEVRLTGQILFVDANSSATEDLLLPPEATSEGLTLIFHNTGGESFLLKDDSDATTVLTIPTAKSGLASCNGTTWYGLLGA